MTLAGADNGAVYTALSSRQVPFMFLTGYDTHDLLRQWASVPILARPAGEAELVAKVEALLNSGDARQDDVRRANVADVVQTADSLLRSSEVVFDPAGAVKSPRWGRSDQKISTRTLRYQVVTHSITRGVGSIVGSELRLRLF